MRLDDVIAVLRDAPRMGAETDVPEGARYIIISDTLAQKMIEELEWCEEIEDD